MGAMAEAPSRPPPPLWLLPAGTRSRSRCACQCRGVAPRSGALKLRSLRAVSDIGMDSLATAATSELRDRGSPLFNSERERGEPYLFGFFIFWSSNFDEFTHKYMHFHVQPSSLVECCVLAHFHHPPIGRCSFSPYWTEVACTT